MGYSPKGCTESDTTEATQHARTSVFTAALSTVAKTWAPPVVLVVKNPHASAGDIEMQILSPAWEDPREEGVATHSSILTWRIPWTEEPGGLQSIGSQRVGHD